MQSVLIMYCFICNLQVVCGPKHAHAHAGQDGLAMQGQEDTVYTDVRLLVELLKRIVCHDHTETSLARRDERRHFACKALHNQDASYVKHYIIRTLCMLHNQDALHVKHYIIRTLCI